MTNFGHNITKPWSVEYRRSARRYLAHLGRKDRERIENAIDRLALDPRDPSLNVKKLDTRSASRLRVGAFRIIFEVHHDAGRIQVVAIGPRGRVYKE